MNVDDFAKLTAPDLAYEPRKGLPNETCVSKPSFFEISIPERYNILTGCIKVIYM